MTFSMSSAMNRTLILSVVAASFPAMASSAWENSPSVEQACHISSETEEGRWYEGQAAIMGTEIAVELFHQNDSEACDAIDAVMQEMRRIDGDMSPFKETSLLSQMNKHAAERFVDVGPELFRLISKSQGYSILTGGAFDVTYASAGRYYDFRQSQKPDPETLREAVKGINYRHLELNHKSHSVRFHHKHVYVDLGGIAKGYAVDQAVEILKDLGIQQAKVSAGGDSRIIGDRLGEPWVVGVRHPRNKDANIVVLPLVDASISTSGDYERFFEKDGVRYHHIIDPNSGDSARNVRSVTVIGAESTVTDALSTSLFVMGAKHGIELIDRLNGIDAIVVDGEGKLHVSEGLMSLTPPTLSRTPIQAAGQNIVRANYE